MILCPSHHTMEDNLNNSGCELWCGSKSDRLKGKLLCAWERLAASKSCFQMLKHDVLNSMAEANEIFSSMSIPLIRLVGLKVEEMGEDGRRSSVAICPSDLELWKGANAYESYVDFWCRIAPNDQELNFEIAKTSKWLRGYKEEKFRTRAACHVAEISNMQRQHLRQLIGLVKMVESMVRSQEQDITERFQECEKYFTSMQKNFNSNFRGLHVQVEDMKRQDSLLPYRLRIAEKSYQALMSLAIKMQRSSFEAFRKGLVNLKSEVEGMVNELASRMCMPLIAFLKELKSHGMTGVVSSLQLLIEQMESEIAKNIPTLCSAYDKLMARLQNVELHAQLQKNELQVVSRQLELTSRALEEKAKTINSLEESLAERTSNEQNLKARLNQQTKTLSELEAELEQNKTKLADTQQLLCTSRRQVAFEHDQMAAAHRRSSELNKQLSEMQIQVSHMREALDKQMAIAGACAADQNTEKMLRVGVVKQEEDCQVARRIQFKDSAFRHSLVFDDQKQLPGTLEPAKRPGNKGAIETFCHKEPFTFEEKRHQKSSQKVVEQILSWIAQLKDIQALIKDAAQQSQDEFLTELIGNFVILCEKDAVGMWQKKVDYIMCREEDTPSELKDWLPLFLLLARWNYLGHVCNLNLVSKRVVVGPNCKQKLKDLVAALDMQLTDMEDPNSQGLQLITVALALVFEQNFTGNFKELHREAICAVQGVTSSFGEKLGYINEQRSVKMHKPLVLTKNSPIAAQNLRMSVPSVVSSEKMISLGIHGLIPYVGNPDLSSEVAQRPGILASQVANSDHTEVSDVKVNPFLAANQEASINRKIETRNPGLRNGLQLTSQSKSEAKYESNSHCTTNELWEVLELDHQHGSMSTPAIENGLTAQRASGSNRESMDKEPLHKVLEPMVALECSNSYRTKKLSSEVCFSPNQSVAQRKLMCDTRQPYPFKDRKKSSTPKASDEIATIYTGFKYESLKEQGPVTRSWSRRMHVPLAAQGEAKLAEAFENPIIPRSKSHELLAHGGQDQQSRKHIRFDGNSLNSPKKKLLTRMQYFKNQDT